MQEITPLQFWIGIATILIPNIYLAFNAFLTYRANLRLNNAQAQAAEEKSDTEAQDRLFTEYDRQINNLRRVEDENKELRPLALKNAILERDIIECRKDKQDWKRYAQKLCEQLEGLGHVPLPFRRTPEEDPTQERIPTVKGPNEFQTIEPIKDDE